MKIHDSSIIEPIKWSKKFTVSFTHIHTHLNIIKGYTKVENLLQNCVDLNRNKIYLYL